MNSRYTDAENEYLAEQARIEQENCLALAHSIPVDVSAHDKSGSSVEDENPPPNILESRGSENQ